MRSILDANPDCIIILSLDGRVETMNAPGRLLMEIDDPASLANLPWSAFWAGRHAEADARASLAAARAGQQSRFQGFCPTAKGAPRWWDVAVTPVMDAHDQPDRILVVSRDVTEVREAERHRERERDFLAAILENLFEGVVACDADGELTLFNRATREFHGLPEMPIPPEEWAQHYALYNIDGVTPLERDEVPLYRAFRGEDVHDAEMVIAPTGRPPRTVRASGRPLRGADGAITGAVVVMHDVTEHLKDLAERRQIEEQFRQAQKMEAVGQLAGGVAHDFNNLLTAITCSVEFLRDGIPIDHELRDDVDQISDATERAAALTRQLLAFGRREMLQPRRIDPGAVIGALTRLLKRVLGPEVDLRLAIDPAAGDVLADASQLEQVIVNLAINARDSMANGGLLMIETEARTIRAPLHHRHGVVEARDYVLITVRDAGCGMDDATLARIFEPFFTTKGPGHGTGLGLATVFGIMTQSAGHVVVESAVGAGTAFTLFLPRLLPDGAAAQHMDIVDASDIVVDTSRPPVVVVDDEHAVRTVMMRVVSRLGFPTIAAANGTEALAIIDQLARDKSIQPALVITDLNMPVMSGRELGDALAAQYPDIPVLYVSGFSADDAFQRGLLDATRPFVRKPFTVEVLASAVQAMLVH